MSEEKESNNIVIGDIHGRDIWQKIVEKEINTNKEIFIGDYWDSFNVSFKDQLENFVSIVEYKRQFPDKVVLLIGNHDFHYMSVVSQQYSGYQDDNASLIGSLMDGAYKEGLLDICYVWGDYLFTHAGVTQTWADTHGIDVSNIEEEMYFLFENNSDAFYYNKKDLSGYGNSPIQSPIWVRPESLIPDVIPHYTQVIGHTHKNNISYYNGEYDAKVIMIDVFDDTNEYLSITDAGPETRHVEN